MQEAIKKNSNRSCWPTKLLAATYILRTSLRIVGQQQQLPQWLAVVVAVAAAVSS